MTTQDKPAVGPLSAVRVTKCLCGHSSCTDYWLTGVGKFVQGSGFEKNEAELIAELLNAHLAPTAPAEAGGSEDKRRREITAVMSALDRFEDLAGRVTATQAEHVLASLAALRPQPSGETLQSLAQAFEDAMEGSHGAWAVSGDEGQPSGETREAVARIAGAGVVDRSHLGWIAFAPFIARGREPFFNSEAEASKYLADARADAILALLRPAAPDGGGERCPHCDRMLVMGCGCNFTAAIPASEGGRG